MIPVYHLQREYSQLQEQVGEVSVKLLDTVRHEEEFITILTEDEDDKLLKLNEDYKCRAYHNRVENLSETEKKNLAAILDLTTQGDAQGSTQNSENIQKIKEELESLESRENLTAKDTIQRAEIMAFFSKVSEKSNDTSKKEGHEKNSKAQTENQSVLKRLKLAVFKEQKAVSNTNMITKTIPINPRKNMSPASIVVFLLSMEFIWFNVLKANLQELFEIVVCSSCTLPERTDVKMVRISDNSEQRPVTYTVTGEVFYLLAAVSCALPGVILSHTRKPGILH